MGEISCRVEALLKDAVEAATSDPCPPRFAEALNWAVFPGGARIRPRLCLAVAAACGNPKYASVPAAALEMLHCASLVHDDLPCFDDSPLRRGKASVHAAYGERLAVLTGDALIVIAFETLCRELESQPALAVTLTGVLARGVAAPHGIAAGQAWECESQVDLSAYHRAKTGSLFASVTEAGAVAAGVSASRQWSTLGLKLGEAYQVADDILDVAGRVEDVGKPVAQDALFERPNSVETLGLVGASQKLRALVQEALNSIPECPRRDELCQRIKAETNRMLPEHLAKLAA